MPLFSFFPKPRQLYSSRQNYHIPPLFGLNMTFESRPKRLVDPGAAFAVIVSQTPSACTPPFMYLEELTAPKRQEKADTSYVLPTLVIYSQGYSRNSNNQRFIEFWKP